MKPKYPDGFLESNLANCLTRTHCEGGCETHRGDTRVVRVIDQSGTPHDWGFYRYCDEAMKEDTRRGMTLLTESDDGFLPTAVL
jgi:hypothetical protein